MASGDIYRCNQCAFEVISWDEGNRYVMDARGKRHYFYHPSYYEEEELERIAGRKLTEEEALDYRRQHGGNERDYLCMDCAAQVRCDPKRDAVICHKCRSATLLRQRDLKGVTCPKCRTGTFEVEVGGCIS
jgi:DNA-directed RNA polymerase subunit RPC12/RpoP